MTNQLHPGTSIQSYTLRTDEKQFRHQPSFLSQAHQACGCGLGVGVFGEFGLGPMGGIGQRKTALHDDGIATRCQRHAGLLPKTRQSATE